jgi:hypothetical protein
MSLKLLVNNHAAWTSFVEELDAAIAAQHKLLEQLTEPSDMYRAQGAIHALQRLKLLRDKYNG